MVRMMQAYNTLGFEVNEMVVSAFVQACSPSVGMNGMMKSGMDMAAMKAMLEMQKKGGAR